MDATRGIAAICVMLFHFTQRAAANGEALLLFPSGPLAVDFFLCLSGFVIAYAYQDKLDGGMPLATFFLLRLVRLYPMYIIGTFMGLLASIAYLLDGDGNSWRAISIVFFFSSLFLPYLRSFEGHFGDVIASNFIFPLNNPAWSLFFELAVNLLYGVKRLSWLGYMAVLPISFFYLAITVFLFETPPGWGTTNIVGGFPRATFSFFAGTFLYTIYKKNEGRTRISVGPVVPIFLIPAMCAMPDSDVGFLLMVLVGVPLTVWLATKNPNGIIIGRAFEMLGELSYPIYAIHVPIYVLAQFTYDKAIGASSNKLLPLWLVAPLGLIVLCCALLLSRLYDAPLRRKLRKTALVQGKGKSRP